MKKKDQSAELRRKAKELLQSKGFSETKTEWKQDVTKLLEELSIHQIELEMQNEELQRSQQLIEAEKKRYQELYDFAPIAYITINTTGNILQLNHAAAKLFGKPREAFYFNSIFPFIEENSKNAFRLMVKDVFQGKEPRIKELRLISERKETIYAQLDLSVFTQPESETPLCKVAISNITAQKQAENDLRQSEEKYRTLFEGAKNPITIYDTEGKILMINSYQEKFRDQSLKSIVGKSLKEFLPEKHQANLKRINYVVRTGESIDFEDEISDGEKTVCFWSVMQPIYNPQGKIYAVQTFSYDITDRKQAEKALRESEEIFRKVWDNSLEGMALTSPEGIVLNVNEAYLKIYGYKREDVAGKPFSIIFPEKNRKVYEKEFRKIFETGIVRPFYEAQVQKADGTIFTVESKGELIYKDNQPFALLAIVRDISERKKNQIALQQSEEKYRLLAENSSDVISVLNTQLKFEYVSPSIEQITGYTPEEYSQFALQQVLTPESYQKALEIHARRDLDDPNDPKNTTELEFYKKDGSTYWAEVVTSIIRNETGQITGFLAQTRDITQRKKAQEALRESEEKLRNLLESIDVGIVVHKADTGIVQVNSAAEEILFAPKNELINQTTTSYNWQFLREDGSQMPENEYPVNLVRQTKKALHNYVVGIKKHAKLKWVMATAIPQFDPQGEIETIIVTSVDITERKRAQQALAESQQNYQLLSDATFEAIFLSEKGICTGQNQSAREMFGYTDDEAVGRPAIEWIHPEHRKTVAEHLKNDYSTPYEVLALRKDGTSFWAEIQARTLNFQGKKLRTTALRDISERKKVEQALRESEERHKMLSELTIEGILIHQDGIAIELNNSFAKMFGYQPDELIGKNMIPLLIRSNDIQIIKRNIQKKHVLPYEATGVRKNGEEFPIEIESRNLTYHGKKIRASSVRDISERKKAEKALKESEERFALAIKGANDGLWDWNLKTSEVFYSPRWKAMLGYEYHELENHLDTWQNLIHPDDSQKAWQAFDNYIKGKSERFECELRMKHKDGQWRNILSRAFMKKDPDGTPERLIGTHLDLTPMRKAQQALKESAQRLKELNATKDKFFSIVAHDLKSPFSSLLGFSELLLLNHARYDAEKREHFIAMIYESASNVFTLLENLLAWARTQTGRMPFSPEHLEIQEMILENTEPQKHTAAPKKISLETKIEKPAQKISADRQMVNTVFRNLITNAIKFTPTGGKITIGNHAPKDGKVLFYVKDNGMGIPKQEQEKLFRIDQNYSTKGTENEKGTGLGLILCKEFIETNKGKIWVQSTPRQGSTFFFTLPLATETQQKQE